MLRLIANKKHERKDDALILLHQKIIYYHRKLQINLQNNLCLLMLMSSLS